MGLSRSGQMLLFWKDDFWLVEISHSCSSCVFLPGLLGICRLLQVLALLSNFECMILLDFVHLAYHAVIRLNPLVGTGLNVQILSETK